MALLFVGGLASLLGSQMQVVQLLPPCLRPLDVDRLQLGPEAAMRRLHEARQPASLREPCEELHVPLGRVDGVHDAPRLVGTPERKVALPRAGIDDAAGRQRALADEAAQEAVDEHLDEWLRTGPCLP